MCAFGGGERECLYPPDSQWVGEPTKKVKNLHARELVSPNLGQLGPTLG